jgi:hypothetical protein
VKFSLKVLKYFLISFFVLSMLKGQTYIEGDYVSDFGADICYNGDGYWSWEEQGFNKVTWISSFATW